MNQPIMKGKAPQKHATQPASKKTALFFACTAAALLAVWKLPSAWADKHLKDIL